MKIISQSSFHLVSHRYYHCRPCHRRHCHREWACSKCALYARRTQRWNTRNYRLWATQRAKKKFKSRRCNEEMLYINPTMKRLHVARKRFFFLKKVLQTKDRQRIKAIKIELWTNQGGLRFYNHNNFRRIASATRPTFEQFKHAKITKAKKIFCLFTWIHQNKLALFYAFYETVGVHCQNDFTYKQFYFMSWPKHKELSF